MRPRIWRLSSLLCGSCLALAAPAIALACGPGRYPSIEDLSFFSPEVIGRPAEAPFFVSDERYYRHVEPFAPDLSGVNLREWQAAFGPSIPADAWSALLYEAPLERVDNLIFSLKGQPGHAPASEDQPFMSYADRKKLVAALYYLGFAKRVEPFATARADEQSWSAKPLGPAERAARDQDMARLVEAGTRALAAARTPFLRQRYALQVLRLHFYRGDAGPAIHFYDDHRAELAGAGSVSWRAMSYAAGALRRAKRHAEADYLYSVVYDRFPPMKVSAFSGLRLWDEDWRASLALARSVREKAVLWQLYGIRADGLRAMQEIRALDPRSDLLPLLVVRAVNKLEVREGPGSARTRPPAPLLAFLDEVAERGDAAQPFVWALAAGHLHAMAGETAAARRLLKLAAARAPKDPVVQRQLRASRLYARLQGIKRAGDVDDALARELEWLSEEVKKLPSPHGEEVPDRQRTFLTFARSRLSSLFRDKGDVVTALSLSDSKDPFYADPANIDRLVQFLEKPKKSAFERFAASSYAPPIDSLREEKALILLHDGRIEESAALLASLKTDTLQADPFAIHVRDCHWCDRRDVKKPMTKAEFVKRLATLLQEAKQDPARAPALYFEVANGLYNATQYGNSEELYRTAGWHLYRAPLTYDSGLAESYYRKAMELSKDRELKAKASFMAARCELNAWYNQRRRDPRLRRKGEDFKAGTWFRTLRDSLADTKYYQEIIRECGYFRTFLQKGG